MNGAVSRTRLKDGYLKWRKLWLHGEDRTWSAKYCVYWTGNWFHSLLHSFHSEHIKQPWLYRNISNGCVRMEDPYCMYIYYNFPKLLKGTNTTTWK